MWLDLNFDSLKCKISYPGSPWHVAGAGVTASPNVKRLEILQPALDTVHWDLPGEVTTSDDHCLVVRILYCTGIAVKNSILISFGKVEGNFKFFIWFSFCKINYLPFLPNFNVLGKTYLLDKVKIPHFTPDVF